MKSPRASVSMTDAGWISIFSVVPCSMSLSLKKNMGIVCWPRWSVSAAFWFCMCMLMRGKVFRLVPALWHIPPQENPWVLADVAGVPQHKGRASTVTYNTPWRNTKTFYLQQLLTWKACLIALEEGNSGRNSVKYSKGKALDRTFRSGSKHLPITMEVLEGSEWK